MNGEQVEGDGGELQQDLEGTTFEKYARKQSASLME
jgi:hypothetical protein